MGRIAVSDGGRVVWNLLSVTGGRNALLPEEPRMIRHLLHVDFQPGRGLQEQVRETLVNAILSGIFAADTPLPSCRQLASQLRVSRNTSALVFESLVNEGYLISRPRSGYYLHPDYHEASPAAVESAPQREAAAPRWGDRLQMTPASRSRSSNRRAGCTTATRLSTASPIPGNSRWPPALGGELAARRGARPGVGHRPY